MTKRCAGKCKKVKDTNEFGKDAKSKDSKNARCKECNRDQSSNWYRNNTEKAKKSVRAYNLANPIVYRRHHLKRFGLSVEQYDLMLQQQNGVCAICKQLETGKTINLCVDHCHKTGKVRGLLCGKCNKALGLIGDNLETLTNAGIYLVKYANDL